MHYLTNLSKQASRLFVVTAIAATLAIAFWVTVGAQSTPISPGYLDFSYQGWTGSGTPTGEKPESKLWWNDGFWWGTLYSSSASEFRIHKLNWGTQTWEDTGIAIDERDGTKADTLWDKAANKLYVVSHNGIQSDGKDSANSATWTRLYRYTYAAATQTYSLDAGFPTTVYQGESETAVLTKGTSGRLWVTYISRGATVDATPGGRAYRVFITYSSDDGTTWSAPFVPTLNVNGTAVQVGRGDVAAVVAFGNNIGVMWNNTIITTTHTLHFAYRADSNTSATDPWTHQMISVPGGADDHISIRSLQATGDGRVFAAVKTSTPLTDPISGTIPLIGMVARDLDGTITFHEYSRNTDKDTRPSLLIDEGDLTTPADDQVRIFVSGKEGGSKVCYKSLAIKFPLSSMGNFPVKDCGTAFIEDTVYKNINNATSTKQNVNQTTGIVVLASDSSVPTSTTFTQVYVHNIMGNPPPVMTNRGPIPGATNLVLSSVVTATFSKPINAATLDASTFTVESTNGLVAGTVTYDVASRTAIFTPNSPLAANTVYTAKLTNGIKDSSGLALNQGIDAGPTIEEWSFTTGASSVGFSSANYSVNEVGGTATITVVLDAPSAQTVTVDYATSDGTATAPADYTAATGTLTFNPGETVKTFTVTIIDDATLEGAETVNVALSNPINIVLGLQSTTLLTIIDDEATTVQFSAKSYTVNEASTQAVIEVTLSRAAAFAITVDYATSDGTAIAGSDYTAATGTLTFAPGETSKTFVVPVVNDSVFEISETVNLQLTNLTGAGVNFGLQGDTAVLTITEGGSQPTVKFSSATYSVNEAGGTATITATLSTPSSLPVTVNYATTSGGTATAGSDFTAAAGTLTFAPGQISKTFTVTIINDTLSEADETVNLALSAPTNAVLGVPINAVLTIVDNDVTLPTVQFATATATKGEGAGTVNVIVNLSAASGEIVTVDYATSDGSATEGSDYASAIDTLTFGPGETSKIIEIALLDDATAEPNETIIVTLSNANGATLGTPSVMTLTIEDNDDGDITYKVYLPIINK